MHGMMTHAWYRCVFLFFITAMMLFLFPFFSAGAADQPQMPQLQVPRPALTAAVAWVRDDEICLEITAPIAFSYRVSPIISPPQLVVEIPEAYLDEPWPTPSTIHGDTLVRSLRWSKLDSQGTRLVLDLAYAVPDWKDSGWQKDSDGLFRLTLRAKRRFIHQQEFPVEPGVKLAIQRRSEPYGPVVVNILAVNLQDTGIKLGVGLGKEGIRGLSTVSSIVRDTGALAAINASFFHSSGLPLGLIVDNGLLASVPVYDRTAFIILKDGSVGLDRAALKAHIKLADSNPMAVHGFNRTRKAGEIVVYNQAYHTATPRSPATRELVIRNGVVVGVGNGGTVLKPGITVVAGDPGSVLKLAQVGTRCQVTWDLTLLGYQVTIPGYQVHFAVAGGPRLVAGGKVHVTADAENFRSDVSQGRAPRTALGITADGVILMVTVNGRQPGVSVGMTLEEVAALMIELGAVEAMNLDGGGSTTMVVRNKVVNMPSDGAERPVGSALLVFDPSRESVQ